MIGGDDKRDDQIDRNINEKHAERLRSCIHKKSSVRLLSPRFLGYIPFSRIRDKSRTIEQFFKFNMTTNELKRE